jgi:hypothetical protein
MLVICVLDPASQYREELIHPLPLTAAGQVRHCGSALHSLVKDFHAGMFGNFLPNLFVSDMKNTENNKGRSQ